MMLLTLACALVGTSAVAMAGAAQSARSQVTPVQKVIEMLHGMLAKGKDEKHAEEVQFTAFKQFCDDTIAEKKQLIKEANERIEKLRADIEKLTATAARLAREIEQ